LLLTKLFHQRQRQDDAHRDHHDQVVSVDVPQAGGRRHKERDTERETETERDREGQNVTISQGLTLRRDVWLGIRTWYGKRHKAYKLSRVRE